MAVKIIKTNWRVEVQPAAIAAPIDRTSDEIREKVYDDLMQEMIDGKCPRILVYRIEVKCDEERVCGTCGRPWRTIAYYHGEVSRRKFHCFHCNAPEEDES